jgi:hypothetical protein
MKKIHPASAATAKRIPSVEMKTHFGSSLPLPPHPTIRKVQTPALDPVFTRLYLASLIGRQRN